MNTPIGKSLSQPLTTAFDPRTIPGCQLWLDAADSNALTLSGSSVTQWRDKTSNATVVSVDTGTPQYTQVNNLGSISFNGSSRMVSASYTGLSGVQNINWFVVANITNVNLVYGLLIGTHYASNFVSQNSFFINSNTLMLWFRIVNGGTAYSVTRPITSGSFIGSTSTNFSNGTYSVFLNGTGTTSSGGPTGTQDSGTVNLYIGNDNYPGESYITGTISECLLYTSDITTTQRQQIEGYLANKWGLTSSLPAIHPFKSLPPISRQFAPIDIPGCVMWLDAADATTLTLSGSNVTQWNDKSGNGNSATASVAATYSNDGVYFSNSYYTTNFTASPTFETSFIVFNKPSVSDGITNTLIGSTTGGRQIGIGTNPGSGLGQYTIMNAGTAFGGTSGTGTVLANTRAFGVATVNSGSTAVALNGGSFSSNVSLSFTAGRLTQLGRENGTSFGYVGFAYEIIFYNSVLTTTQRQQVESYLASKWGLRGSLPSTHPFKLYNAVTPLFNPVQISNCTLWLDGTVSLNGNVWQDKSPSSNNATLTSGTITTTTVNGIQALSFSVAQMSYSNSLIFNGTTGSSCFFVFSVPNAGNGQLLHTVLGDLHSHLLWIDQNVYENIGFSTRRGVAGFLHSTLQMYTNIANRSNNTILFRNGSQISSSAYGSAYTSLTYAVGNQTYRWTGTACEVLVYTRTLSLSEQQQVEGYLAHKWGLVNSLPASHAYKKFIP